MNFYKKFPLFIFFLFFGSAILFSSYREFDYGYNNKAYSDSVSQAEKIVIINKTAGFIRNDFCLDAGANFYTDYQSEDKPFYYLYFSSPDSVYCDLIGLPFRFYGTDEAAAIAGQKEYEQKGFHTLLYHTAGTSSAQLNSILLGYRGETISFILFHEAMHRHLASKKAKIPYEITEAVCDILGNYGTVAFAKKTRAINKSISKTQQKTNEEIYRTINKYYFCLKKTMEKAQRDSIFILCENEIKINLKKSDDFQKDRFIYKVNNAFFVRNRDYAQNYFLLKELYLKINNPERFIKIIVNLPEDKTAAKNSLLEKLINTN